MSTARTSLSLQSAGSEAALLVGTSGLAAVGHAVALLALWAAPALGGWFFPPPPETPLEIMEVSLIVEAHSDSAMAQMDVAPPAVEAPVDADAPVPEDDPGLTDQGTAEEVPDNASDLTIHQEDAQEEKGDPNRQAMDERRKELLRKARLDALRDAPTGSEASTAGDPDSTSSERINLGGSGVADRELALYVNSLRNLFKAEFSPLPTIAQQNPEISAKLLVRFDVETGVVQSWSWIAGGRSDNASWNAAAERAVQAVPRVPVPKERLRPLLVDGAVINFNGDME